MTSKYYVNSSSSQCVFFSMWSYQLCTHYKQAPLKKLLVIKHIFVIIGINVLWGKGRYDVKGQAKNTIIDI